MGTGVATQIGFLLFFIAIMYLLLIRPQRKKEREIQTMRNNLMVGDEVITIGGICGKIVKTKGETIVIQVGADKLKFELMKWGVSKVVESTTRPTSARKTRAADDYDDDDGVDAKKRPRKMRKPVEADYETIDDDDDDADEIKRMPKKMKRSTVTSTAESTDEADQK